MTAWQDEPPMTRRALRESERSRAAGSGSKQRGEAAPEQADRPRPRAKWQLQAPSEPLHYNTQAKPQIPSYDGASFRSRHGSPASDPASDPAPEPPASHHTEAPAYRLRDFSPEARATSRAAQATEAPTPADEGWPSAVPGGDLDYRTSAKPIRPAIPLPAATPQPAEAAAPVAPPVPLPPTDQPAAPSAPSASDHTVTRRELRAMRAAAARGRTRDEKPAAQDEQPSAVAMAPEAPAAAGPVIARAPDVTEDPPALIEPPRPAGGVLHALPMDQLPSPVRAEPLRAEPPRVQPAESAADEPATEAAATTAPEAYSPPLGHWSNQPTIDDEYQASEHTFSRDLSSSDAITTSALVLPSIPAAGPITGPVSSTGEILITGSIDLPRSFSSSGIPPARYDEADVDALIDAGDREEFAANAAPVRAIRAVSTHTSSHGVIAGKKPRGNRLPMVLAITTGVMMVGVVVLLVAAMAFNIF